MRAKSLASILCIAVLLSACHNVTVRPEGTLKRIDAPDYHERKTFWFWGLVNEHHVEVKEICGAKGVAQMQAQSTCVDTIFNIITLGIYAPRSARVWCND